MTSTITVDGQEYESCKPPLVSTDTERIWIEGSWYKPKPTERMYTEEEVRNMLTNGYVYEPSVHLDKYQIDQYMKHLKALNP